MGADCASPFVPSVPVAALPLSCPCVHSCCLTCLFLLPLSLPLLPHTLCLYYHCTSHLHHNSHASSDHASSHFRWQASLTVIRKMTRDLARLGQLCQVTPSHAKSPKHAKGADYVVLDQKKDATAKSAPRHPNSTDLANFRDLAKTAKTSNVTSK